MTVLLVVDDPAIVASLSPAGLACEVVASAETAIERLSVGDVVAIVLDLDVAELGVVDFMRARRMFAPIVALGPADVARCVNALDRGVDDYVRKPFQHEELLARLRAALRRSAAPRWAPLSCNRVTLLPDQLVEVGIQQIQLSPAEHELLELLLRRQGEAVDRSTILAEVASVTSQRSAVITAHISSLRAKLGTSLVEIECVRSIGYRLRPVKTRGTRRLDERRR